MPSSIQALPFSTATDRSVFSSSFAPKRAAPRPRTMRCTGAGVHSGAKRRGGDGSLLGSLAACATDRVDVDGGDATSARSSAPFNASSFVPPTASSSPAPAAAAVGLFFAASFKPSTSFEGTLTTGAVNDKLFRARRTLVPPPALATVASMLLPPATFSAACVFSWPSLPFVRPASSSLSCIKASRLEPSDKNTSTATPLATAAPSALSLSAAWSLRRRLFCLGDWEREHRPSTRRVSCCAFCSLSRSIAILSAGEAIEAVASAGASSAKAVLTEAASDGAASTAAAASASAASDAASAWEVGTTTSAVAASTTASAMLAPDVTSPTGFAATLPV
mmetsp:Transcript_8336/g.21181  ORF Transcript_8336/g.21181 Transcript_8336/m.21181 type:complete len:335 (+) Transcript_8336:1062-2066(+)